jgi:hypothetical protein
MQFGIIIGLTCLTRKYILLTFPIMRSFIHFGQISHNDIHFCPFFAGLAQVVVNTVEEENITNEVGKDYA